MILTLLHGSAHLQERKDFKRLAIVADAQAYSQMLAGQLPHIERVDADGKRAWIPLDVLRQLADAERTLEWERSFRHMIEQVRPFGWVDPVSGAVRAHIELVAEEARASMQPPSGP